MMRLSARPTPNQRGFTLIELLIGVLITASICGATVISISQALRAKTNSEARRQSFSRAQMGAQRIALDLENIIRDGDLYNTRVLITDGASGDQPSDGILLFTKTLQPTRPLSAQSEGDHAEVQYRLQPDERAAPARRTSAASRGAAPATMVLWRRADPIPDEVPDGGGVAFPLVEHAAGLSIEGFDGRNWLPTWDSDRDGLPHAVRVTLTATSDDGLSRASARKVVAIDRVPVPLSTAAQNQQTGAKTK